MRTLTIDIGTNSTLYLIADVTSDGLRVVERGIAPNKLGAAKTDDGAIPASVIEANRAILARMLERGKALACNVIKAVGTQAIRSSRNPADYMAMTTSLGLDFEIIDGEQEATLAWRGVTNGKPSPQRLAVLDIGGGSSELIVGQGSDIEFSSSIPVGAVTATRQFSADPPSTSDVQKLAKDLTMKLTPWQGVVSDECQLIGIAGTCTALASLELKVEVYQHGILEGQMLRSDSIRRWKDRLTKMTLMERENLQGMPPARASVLPAGTIILEAALKTIGMSELTVSEKGIMFGLALALLD